MTPPAFLADEDFREDTIQAVLRLDPAVDFATVRGVGLGGATDDIVLAFARAHSRVVVSHDANTMTAAAIACIRDGSGIAGLLIVPQSSDRRAVAEDLVMIANASEAAEWHDVIDFLPW